MTRLTRALGHPGWFIAALVAVLWDHWAAVAAAVVVAWGTVLDLTRGD